MNKNIKLGNIGENRVINFLERKKFKILDKKFKAKYGEVDIIAQRGNLIAFIEVKTRQRKYFPISNVVTFRKQQKIIKSAKFFILKNNIFDKILRFDIATVLYESNNYKIEYLKNAFQEL